MDMKRLLIVGLLLTGACRSAGTDPTDEKLAGSWRWVSSSGGIAGRTFTPASENYNVRFTFTGNQVTVFRNDSTKGTAIFTVRGDEVTYQPSLSVFLFDPAIDTQTLQQMPGDSIALNDPCCDRYGHIFVRDR